jgi:hypothetical protein
MYKLLRLLLLLTLSFNLNAEEITPNLPLDKLSIEEKLDQLQTKFKGLNTRISHENDKISTSIDHNNNVVNETRNLIKEVNKLLLIQSEQRKDILKVIDKVKYIPEKNVDLSLSLEPDAWGIGFNFLSALIIALTSLFASLYVTFRILTKTLANETDKQGLALENNLKQTKLLNDGVITTQLEIAKLQDIRLAKDLIAQTEISKDDIGAQAKISSAQLDAQMTLNTTQAKEAHSLKIDEFRQVWINTFREDISVLFKSFITLKDFHSVEDGFFIAWDILKRAEKIQREIYEELVELAAQKTDLISRVRAELRINEDKDYIESLKYTSYAKKQFEQYKNEFKEFNNLHATIIEQKTKLLLMFNPNRTPDENHIVNKLDNIHLLLSLGERTFMPHGNKVAIDNALIELQPVVQDMLKIEWNRVKRVKPL